MYLVEIFRVSQGTVGVPDDTKLKHSGVWLITLLHGWLNWMTKKDVT